MHARLYVTGYLPPPDICPWLWFTARDWYAGKLRGSDFWGGGKCPTFCVLIATLMTNRYQKLRTMHPAPRL